MNILDTTLRDGSYIVDFRFTLEDVKDIVNKAARLGIKYIEIGHGMGLGASGVDHGEALFTDLEYIDSANNYDVKYDSILGMFCIPGIAKINDLAIAREHGLSFIRIGFNATDYKSAVPYIREAKKQGYIVMINLMKSYIISPAQFGKIAKCAEDEGVDVIYIVDSARCMTSSDVEKYYGAISNNSCIKIGFHGHNNLGLAVNNTVHAIELGFDMVDCTFQGIGRSLGNASLEQTLMVLKRKGYDVDVDMACLLEYGYAALRNIVDVKLMHPLDMICGYAGFHSGYIKQIYKCSIEKNVDPLRLILAYSELDKKELKYDKLLEVADGLPIDTNSNPYNFNIYFSERYSDV